MKLNGLLITSAVLVLTALLLAGPGAVQAEERDFDAERYMDATIARLILARDVIVDTGSPPDAQAESVLLAMYGFTNDIYYEQSSRYSEEITAYLRSHPAVQRQIDALAAEIEQLVSAGGQ